MFDEARAAMAAVLDGQMHPGVLLAADDVEELAGFAAALRERCVETAVAPDRPVVWCTEGAPATAGAAIVLQEPTEAFCPDWRRLRHAFDSGTTLCCLEKLLAPMRPTAYVVGVDDAASAERVAAALCRLDARRAIVLHSGGAIELCDGAVGELELPAAEVDPAVLIAGLCLYAAWLAVTPAAGVAAANGALSRAVGSRQAA